VSTWNVRALEHFISDVFSHIYPPSGLQGHAIKNQDLLIASGTITFKGSEGLTAADEDVQAAVSTAFYRPMDVKLPRVPASTDPGNGSDT
jgi:hypothetical protein